MDSNKNIVPCFSGRLPKDLTPDIADHLLCMHVVGVIVHGNPEAGFISLIFSFFCPPVAQLVPGYDVRSQLVSALLQDGKSIPGYLAIHAKDAHGREMASSLVDAQLDASQKLWKAAANAAQKTQNRL